jgi:hypothetical protein
MRIIAASLIALTVLASIAVPASTASDGRSFWDRVDSEQN